MQQSIIIIKLKLINYIYTTMDQQQHLQSAITTLNSNTSSPSKIYRSIAVVVKALDRYNSDPQVLPSERFIPCCLFTVPDKLYLILNHDPKILLQEKPQKMGYNLVLAMYLKGLLKLLQESADQIKHIIVEGMSRSIKLAGAYPVIIKKWIKVLLQLWSTSHENLQISLRCHVALSKYLQNCSSTMYMWGVRRMYVSYFQNCKQVSWRNFEHINFMNNSFCQILKFNTQRAYYVLFGYLRSIALQLDKLHKSKRKQKQQLTTKLFSNQILNCFKLFTAIVSRVDCEDFTALLYPLCEMFASYERITQAPEYIPLKLHLLEYELTIMEAVGIYIPHTLELIEKLVKYPVFNKKITKKTEKIQANIQLAYKVSKTELTQALLVNELFRSLVTKMYWFQSLMCKVVYGPEVIMKLHKILKNHKYIFSEYQQQSQKTTALFKHDQQKLYDMRAQQKMSLTNVKKINKFEQKIKATIFSGTERYQQLKQDEEQLIRNKLAAEQQDKIEGDEDDEQNLKEDEDEVNSGWQEASEGASEMDMKQIEDEESEDQEEDMENVSYEDDPEDADEAAKQWSEEQWSSQNQINNQ